MHLNFHSIISIYNTLDYLIGVRFGVKLIKVHIMVLLRDYAIRDTWFIDITGKERLSGSQSLSNLLYLKIRAGRSTR